MIRPPVAHIRGTFGLNIIQSQVQETDNPKTDEWVETGDWEFNVERSHFTIKPDKNTLDAIQALSGMPAEELRSVLGRVIDTVQMTMVSGKDPFSNTDLGGAASILCGVLRDIIVPGETIRFTGAVMCPGSSEGYIVHAMVSRLGFGPATPTQSPNSMKLAIPISCPCS